MSEILNYRCINGHKWKSKKWPTSTTHGILQIMAFGKAITKGTQCPECGTNICMCQTEDGKQGAMHIDFKKNV